MQMRLRCCHHHHHLSHAVVVANGIACFQPPKVPHFLPTVHLCVRQREDDHQLCSQRLSSSVTGGVVALGKFDALHIGHRELSIQASKIGVPYLLSFVGIAKVLGWEPRAPIVAKCDRKRILSSWAPFCCGNVAPMEFEVEFSSVRHLTPRQFVEKLSKELGICGVVAGENYRFGYKAAGDASELVRLCEEYDIGGYIINSVMDKNQGLADIATCNSKERGQVSSTRVRYALAKGDMKYVSELLGRQHRLMVGQRGEEEFITRKHGLSAPRSCLLNLPPKDGFYENCTLWIGEKNLLRCKTTIDATHIHLDFDEGGTFIPVTHQGLRILGIEFGESRF